MLDWTGQDVGYIGELEQDTNFFLHKSVLFMAAVLEINDFERDNGACPCVFCLEDLCKAPQVYN